MFDAIDWGSFWEWGAPEPEQCTYFRRTGEDTYENEPDGTPLLMIRTGQKGGKEDELGGVTGPNYGSRWVIWLDWLTAAGLPTPRLDDYFVDASGDGWSVLKVNVQLRQQVVILENCCSMSSPFPGG